MNSFSITNTQAATPTLLSSIVGEHGCEALIVGAIENVLGVTVSNNPSTGLLIAAGEQFSLPVKSTKGLYIEVPFPGDTAQLTLVP